MPQPLPKISAVLVILSFLLLTASAWAHATIVFGTITTQPNPPRTDAPLNLQLELLDPASVPVEDAFVLAEFNLEGEEVRSTRFVEVEPAGNYEAELQLPEPGTYEVTLRDQTYRQEEAVSQVQLPIGSGQPVEPIEFVFPPTAVGGSLTTWLIWLIGVPLIAGVVVTLLVLKSGPAERSDPKERE